MRNTVHENTPILSLSATSAISLSVPSAISLSNISTMPFTHSSFCPKAAAYEKGISFEGNSKDEETGVTVDSFATVGETRVFFRADNHPNEPIIQAQAGELRIRDGKHNQKPSSKTDSQS
ncbi:hypothetical protein Tco_1258380 [Tanacetum coccineum]